MTGRKVGWYPASLQSRPLSYADWVERERERERESRFKVHALANMSTSLFMIHCMVSVWNKWLRNSQETQHSRSVSSKPTIPGSKVHARIQKVLSKGVQL